jgi:hypothetical protein
MSFRTQHTHSNSGQNLSVTSASSDVYQNSESISHIRCVNEDERFRGLRRKRPPPSSSDTLVPSRFRTGAAAINPSVSGPQQVGIEPGIPADMYGKMLGAAELYRNGCPAGKAMASFGILDIDPKIASRHFDLKQPDLFSMMGRKYAMGVSHLRMPQPKLSASEIEQMGVHCKNGATVRQALEKVGRTDVNPDNVRIYFDSSTHDGLTQRGRNHLPFKK